MGSDEYVRVFVISPGSNSHPPTQEASLWECATMCTKPSWISCHGFETTHTLITIKYSPMNLFDRTTKLPNLNRSRPKTEFELSDVFFVEIRRAFVGEDSIAQFKRENIPCGHSSICDPLFEIRTQK